jgi:hypothetical protein
MCCTERNEPVPAKEHVPAPAAPDLLEHALTYLGYGWSVIPILDTKKPALNTWKRWQTERPSQDQVREWLANPCVAGVGVICGEVSGGLAVVDFDDAAAFQAWSDDHPEESREFPTVQTGRGFHVYGRLPGCKIHELRSVGIDSVGELRGNGAYVAAPPFRRADGGQHVWMRPIQDGTLPDLNRIVRLTQTGVTHSTHSTHSTHRTHTKTPTPDTSYVSPGDWIRHPGVLDAIRSTVPLGGGIRHKSIFRLIRRLKSIPELANVDARALRPVMDRWYRLAERAIKTKDFGVNWAEFVAMWPRVKADFDGKFANAMDRAENTPPPACAAPYNSPKISLLLSLCRELQRDEGQGSFFLGCRQAGRAVEVSHKSAASMLAMLCEDGHLCLESKGTRLSAKASDYRYLGEMGDAP